MSEPKRQKIVNKQTKNKITEKEDPTIFKDKKLPVDQFTKPLEELKTTRSAPINHKIIAKNAKYGGVDMRDPLRSLSKDRRVPANIMIEAFESQLERLTFASSQIKRHPVLCEIYDINHIKILTQQYPTDLRTIVETLVIYAGRPPTAILIKDVTGRMDIIFDTRPAGEYLCASIQPLTVKKEEEEEKKYEVDEFATVMSLHNRVIAMDELLPVFQSNNTTNTKQISPASAAANALFQLGPADQGTSDTFEKLFMKKKFQYIDHFVCSMIDIDQLAPTGHGINHGKIVLTSV